jgi:polynucleotide 5'-kinase involved in rRNA processing
MNPIAVFPRGGLLSHFFCFELFLPIALGDFGRNKRGFLFAAQHSDTFASSSHRKYLKSSIENFRSSNTAHFSTVSCMADQSKRIKVIVISGPTGVGKSALAELLAKQHGPAELISADSVQV